MASPSSARGWSHSAGHRLNFWSLADLSVALALRSAKIDPHGRVRRTALAKRFVALARVSSREQEREGFSLDVQEDALRQYADRTGGEIVRLFRIAETASKKDERKTFKELLAFAKANAHRLDGL